VITHPEAPEAPVVVDPSLMDVPTDMEPMVAKALPAGQRLTKPGQKQLEPGTEEKVPVVAPLPAALKGKPPPVETTGETSRTRISGSTLKWLVVPLLVLLAVAGWIAYSIVDEQSDNLSDDAKPAIFRRSGDGRSRETAPMGQPNAPGPRPSADDELAAPGKTAEPPAAAKTEPKP
jgi:hypothetical protein